MTPTEEVQLIKTAIEVASTHGLLTEVIWSALQASGTIEEKLDFGINEWIK